MSQTIMTQLSSTPSGRYHDETGAVAERRGILGAAREARAAPPCSASEATRRHLRQRAIDRKRTAVNPTPLKRREKRRNAGTAGGTAGQDASQEPARC